jgi:hypothetical protein
VFVESFTTGHWGETKGFLFFILLQINLAGFSDTLLPF